MWSRPSNPPGRRPTRSGRGRPRTGGPSGPAIGPTKRRRSRHGEGSGPNGRILIADVERAIASPPAAGPEPVKLAGMRRTIAARMLQSAQTSAPVTLMSEANITEAMTLRAGLARQWSEHGLSPLALVIKAAARALKDHPRLNAVQGEDSYQVMPNIDIGVAVSLEEGLITPVLRGADGKGLAQIAEESRSWHRRCGKDGQGPNKLPEGRSRSQTWARTTWTLYPHHKPAPGGHIGHGPGTGETSHPQWGDRQRSDDVSQSDV